MKIKAKDGFCLWRKLCRDLICMGMCNKKALKGLKKVVWQEDYDEAVKEVRKDSVVLLK